MTGMFWSWARTAMGAASEPASAAQPPAGSLSDNTSFLPPLRSAGRPPAASRCVMLFEVIGRAAPTTNKFHFYGVTRYLTSGIGGRASLITQSVEKTAHRSSAKDKSCSSVPNCGNQSGGMRPQLAPRMVACQFGYVPMLTPAHRRVLVSSDPAGQTSRAARSRSGAGGSPGAWDGEMAIKPAIS